MNNQPTVTEHDAVLRERQAFVEGCRGTRDESPQWWWQAMDAAKRRYPLPPDNRPRVVADPLGELPRIYYSVRPDFAGRPAIHWSRSTEDQPVWSAIDFPVCVTVERLAVWANLIANPSEECSG